MVTAVEEVDGKTDTLEPTNYRGRPYSGKLCKFLSLGSDPDRPFAGQHSLFRQLWVEQNGAQPGSSEVTMRIFERVLFCVSVETVTRDRNGNERAPEHWYSIARDIHRARPDCPQHLNTAPANTSTERTITLIDQHSNKANTPLAERVEGGSRSDSQRCG